MPELPEVETVARQLAPKLRGCVLRSVTLLDAKLKKPALLSAGARVSRVYRLGKEVAIEFAQNGGGLKRDSVTVLVHLRMTGRLLWYRRSGSLKAGRMKLSREGSASSYRRQFDKSRRAIFSFDRGELVFADTRRFGTVVCKRLPALKPGVVDPVKRGFSPTVLRDLLRGSKQMIKPWLLRQDRLIGLGNIYASEILFEAGISPLRRAGGLSEAENRRLYGAITRVLRRAIRCCGTTFSDFQQTTGEVGGYQRFLKVYDRLNLPCRICKTPIKRLVQSRSTYYCPHCQKRKTTQSKKYAAR